MINVKVFKTPGCPYCKAIIERIKKQNDIDLEVIDVAANPEMAKKYNILSAPTTVINDSIYLTGALSEADISEWFKKIQKPGYKKGYVQKLLSEGEAARAVQAAENDPEIPVILADFIADSDIMVRLGAMVALDDIKKTNSQTIKKAIAILIKLLDRKEPSIRGDAAFILGLVGD
jgi:glutaredoxin